MHANARNQVQILSATFKNIRIAALGGGEDGRAARKAEEETAAFSQWPSSTSILMALPLPFLSWSSGAQHTIL